MIFLGCGDQVGGASDAGRGYLGYLNGGPLLILLVETLNQIALKIAIHRVPLVFLRLKLFHQLTSVQQGNYFELLLRVPGLTSGYLPILLTTVGQRRTRVRLDRFDDHGGNLPPGRTRGWILQDQLGDLHRGPLLTGRSGRVVKHVRAAFADYLNGTLPHGHIVQRVYRKGSRITATLLRQRVTFRVSHLAIKYLRLQVIASSIAHLLRTKEC